MANQQPYELNSGPLELYIGPVGEPMPAIGTEPPGGNWTLLATLGDQEYGEEGITIAHSETVNDFRGLGGTGPLKAFRAAEELDVSFMCYDMTLEEVTRALNLTTVATDSDDKTLDLYKGLTVPYRALLVRGEDKGPYGASYNIQWELPRVRPNSAPSMVFTKGEPVGYSIAFKVMEDLNAASDSARFGILRTQFQN